MSTGGRILFDAESDEAVVVVDGQPLGTIFHGLKLARTHFAANEVAETFLTSCAGDGIKVDLLSPEQAERLRDQLENDLRSLSEESVTHRFECDDFTLGILRQGKLPEYIKAVQRIRAIDRWISPDELKAPLIDYNFDFVKAADAVEAQYSNISYSESLTPSRANRFHP